jgi:hypothetical protein
MPMPAQDPFAGEPVLAAMAPDDAAAKLREMDETVVERAPVSYDATKTFSGFGFRWPFGERLYASTSHAFGFLPKEGGDDTLQHAGSIKPNLALKEARVKIVLNRLRIADYPGSGTHRVLFDFYARNQVANRAEELHFNATYRVREGEQAPITGYPIFLNLGVGDEGLAFRCRTVNVKNDSDEAFLDFLDGDIFRAGLKLTKTLQPAIAPLSALVLATTKSIAKRHRNVPVQDFDLGLDFSGTRMGARLAEGDYIVVQIPDRLRVTWRWDDWRYDPASGELVSREDNGTLIPYNYVVFGVSRFGSR